LLTKEGVFFADLHSPNNTHDFLKSFKFKKSIKVFAVDIASIQALSA
jgi:hypothetical protein